MAGRITLALARPGRRKVVAFYVTLAALTTIGVVTGQSEAACWALASVFAAYCGGNVWAKKYAPAPTPAFAPQN